jgi:hypothetical protein
MQCLLSDALDADETEDSFGVVSVIQEPFQHSHVRRIPASQTMLNGGDNVRCCTRRNSS